MAITESHSSYTGYGVSCFGASDGDIDITVTGGAGNYIYIWSNGAITEDLEDLSADTYSVTVIDQNGNMVSISVDITQTEEMVITETHSDYTGYGVTCFGASDGDIDVTVTGGTGVYTYEWATGDIVVPIEWPTNLDPQALNDGAGTESNATLMIDLESNDILLGGSPIQSGDLVGMFYEENGQYICAGFIVWNADLKISEVYAPVFNENAMIAHQ